MTMFQPFEGVWLPRGIEIAAGITLANGSFEAAYERAFSEYRQADVKSRIRVPKSPEEGDRPLKGPVPESRIGRPHRFAVRPRRFCN